MNNTAATGAGTVRVATFNASLNRNAEGELVSDLSAPGDAQARTVAEIVQRAAPDLLLVNEFDYAAGGEAADLFRSNYLERGQDTLGLGAAPPVEYPYAFVAPSNTGVVSGFDLDNNGAVASEVGDRGHGEDALGFGLFPGQYGMAVFSKYPILHDEVRTFQTFLWKDMPGARLPDHPATPEPGDWYSAEELAAFRLPSKSFWDVPVLWAERSCTSWPRTRRRRPSTSRRTATGCAAPTRSAWSRTTSPPARAATSTTTRAGTSACRKVPASWCSAT